MSRKGTKTITVPVEDHELIKQCAELEGMEIKEFVIERCLPEIEPIQLPERERDVISKIAEKNGLEVEDLVIAVFQERFPMAFKREIYA